MTTVPYYSEEDHRLMKCLTFLINKGGLKAPALSKGSGLNLSEVNAAMSKAVQQGFVTQSGSFDFSLTSLGLITVETYSRWRVVASENNPGNYTF